MIKDKASFFAKLANNDSLKENLLSIILAKNPNIDITKRESFFENLSRFYSIYTLENRLEIKEEITHDENSIESWIGLDLRVKNIKLQSIRGFNTSQIPFGIDFLNEQGDISSMIILGGNASGKSSIYDAIEYNYCKRIGEAELRTSESFQDDDNKFKDFLTHFNSPFSNSSCDVETPDKTFSLNSINIPKSVRQVINPNSHFISAFDIYQFGKLDYQKSGNQTFQNLVAQNIGLSEYLEIEKQLYAFASYSRRIESTAVSNLTKEIETATKGIENNQRGIESNQTQIKKLEETPSPLSNNELIQPLLDLTAEIKNTSFDYTFDFSTFKSHLEAFTKHFNEYETSAIKSGSLQELQFFNSGLSLLVEHTDCPFCNNSKSTKEEINDYVNNRISQIESLNKLSRDLNNAVTYLIEYFNLLSTGLNIVKTKASQEISKIKDKTEFNELSYSATNFISFINTIIATDFFQDISAIEEKAEYLKDKFSFINKILSRNENYLSQELASQLSIISKFNEKRKQLILKIETDLKTKLTTTTGEEQIAILKNEIVNLQRQIEVYKRDIQTKTPELVKATNQLELFQKVKSETKEYYKQFHILLAKETQQAFEPIKGIVKSVLDKYLFEEERQVDLIIETKADEVDQETGEVISEIITAYLKPRDDKYPPISVNKYFNTFHYRLFCTMVGISIAVASRKNTGINLPLVLDDVFYASDFEKRTSIEEFLQKLFKLFQEFVPDKPLQLILFTHDQLVFESAISAVSELPKIQFAKLFPPEDAEKETDYLNLIYKIPAYLPHRIMQNQLL